MAFEQATIRIENESAFGELTTALDRVFSADQIKRYLKKLNRLNIRVRDLNAILATGTIEAIAAIKPGTVRILYQALTVSDQSQLRELYLSKVEEVDPALRAKFNKLFRYY